MAKLINVPAGSIAVSPDSIYACSWIAPLEPMYLCGGMMQMRAKVGISLPMLESPCWLTLPAGERARLELSWS